MPREAAAIDPSSDWQAACVRLCLGAGPASTNAIVGICLLDAIMQLV